MEKIFNFSKATLQRSLLGLSGVVGFFLLWQVLLWIEVLNPNIMPSPLAVVQTFWDQLTNVRPTGATLPAHIISSFISAGYGFLIAVVVGVTLGTTMGWYKTLDRFIMPIFELIRPIAPIAWIPLTILWIGIGTGARAFIIFLSAVVPCVINSHTGVRNTPEPLINVAKTCGATNFQIFRLTAIPYSLPMTFAGIRISLNNAWATLVGAELLASNRGLGYMILQGRQFARADLIVVGMLTIGVIGYIISKLLMLLERKVLKWRV